MEELFIPSKLKEKVEKWRKENYPCKHKGIANILNYNLYEDEKGNKILRYLRKAQFEALETYWYLRIVEGTPHMFDIYKKLYKDDTILLSALGIPTENKDVLQVALKGGVSEIIKEIKNNDQFVRKFNLQAVRESLTLDYPSYILALAMGSGKTVLIGSIIATEFAMALEYQNDFVKNALVFAPGKTILGALKEILDIPFDKILPPRYYKQFLSNVKITYTQDKEKDIPVQKKSSFNIIVTNTEKIRIQKRNKNFGSQRTLYNYNEKEEEEIANLRLQTIASLPHLALFSDEAHHTYGQSLDKGLKKVRQTVDYLAENTNVLVVVNTTGTPYYKKQMLRDVVFWYGLSQGIKDGILKEVKDSIYSYDLDMKDFVEKVLEDFFENYKNVKIYNGAKSKIAIYFPQTDDVRKIKPFVEQKVTEFGLDSSVVFDVNNKSDEKKKDFFNNRINETTNPYRVYLLVNMGTEGWNCPSLYATALARKLKTSNNFVLQASSRCLRQILNNEHKARIYLSKDNVNVLDSQLKETYGETLKILNVTSQDMKSEKIILRKVEIPKILIKRKIKRVIIDDKSIKEIKIKKPDIKTKTSHKVIYDIREREEMKRVLSEKEIQKITLSENFEDIYGVAVNLSSIYRLDLEKIYDILRTIYPDGEIPTNHIEKLQEQIDKQNQKYKITEEEVEVALALIKKEGFDKEEIRGKNVYTAEITYNKTKEKLLLKHEKFKVINKKDFGFHYSPYKMDSNPEVEFFKELLEKLNENPDDIEDIYFTGQLTSRDKTEFLFEYKDKKGKWRNYAPDFVIRKKNGKILIVEIKGERFYEEEKDMALKIIENINPDKLKYEILFTKDDELKFGEFDKVKTWVYNKK